MLERDLLTRYSDDDLIIFGIALKRVERDKQIVFGEVYVPKLMDTHNEMMLPEDVELMAHRFMGTIKNDRIDVMHNNRCIQAVVIESFIARAGDELYHEGAWVLALKIDDADVWADIKCGKLNGFSMESLVTRSDAEVEISFYPHIFGVTENVDGHRHYFFIQLDCEGNICGGSTDKVDDHDHKVTRGTATLLTNEHAHRISFP